MTASFRDQVITDAAAAVRGLTVALGERLGLYRALAGAGPLTAKELATRTGLDERYTTEWLHAQTSAGYLQHDPAHDTYQLPDTHATVLADEDDPAYVAAFFTALKALYATEDQLAAAYRSGGGVEWSDHHDSLDTGMGSFFLPGYRANLVQHWLPALDGVVDRLRAGGKVADVGCGVGHSTLIMAQAFPKPPSTGSTTPPPPSSTPANWPARPGWPTGSRSRSPRPTASPAKATTWSATSTCCTTWATRSPPPAGPTRRWPRKVSG